jgi:hypothetical protein
MGGGTFASSPLPLVASKDDRAGIDIRRIKRNGNDRLGQRHPLNKQEKENGYSGKIRNFHKNQLTGGKVTLISPYIVVGNPVY